MGARIRLVYCWSEGQSKSFIPGGLIIIVLSYFTSFRMLEEGLPEQAVTLYRKAADLAQVNDKPQTASDMFDRAVRVLVRAEK